MTSEQCLGCGYTAQDCKIHGDHHLCDRYPFFGYEKATDRTTDLAEIDDELPRMTSQDTAVQEYVMVFLFYQGWFVGVKKKHGLPVLKDKWNGVGGKVEAGEDVESAARREFLEETGIKLPDDLKSAGRLVIKTKAVVHVFAAKTGTKWALTDKNDVGELLEWRHERDVIWRPQLYPYNLPWLVPLCLSGINNNQPGVRQFWIEEELPE